MACRAVLAHACVQASLLSLSLAVLLAHALERWQFWSRQLLTICVRLALILTPVVTGYVLLLVFGQTASVGHPLMMPLVSFSVSTYDAHDPFGDRGGDPKLEEAATTIGARAIRVFLTGTMPLLAAGLVAGWFGFRQSYERIWGNNHLCGKYTGPEANAFL
jgi:molybdate transport system permease protein